jgi:hypothetical protein
MFSAARAMEGTAERGTSGRVASIRKGGEDEDIRHTVNVHDYGIGDEE